MGELAGPIAVAIAAWEGLEWDYFQDDEEELNARLGAAEEAEIVVLAWHTEQVQALRDAVLEIHTPFVDSTCHDEENEFCNACLAAVWPCPTARAVGVE